MILQVNQNMRYDHSVRALKTLLDRGVLGEPVLATIELRAIPHWMPWAEGWAVAFDVRHEHSPPRHLSLLAGRPGAGLASTRRTRGPSFHMATESIFTFSNMPNGARASGWDDVWAGPRVKGPGPRSHVRWRVEGTDGLALGTIGWPGWPATRPQHDRLFDDRRPRHLASPALE